MDGQPIDPIISEVRAARDAHGARFDYDVAAISGTSGRCRKSPDESTAFLHAR